jgi:4-amino-4-deoxy-L-arabinose transferase-like glycosyltransferase
VTALTTSTIVQPDEAPVDLKPFRWERIGLALLLLSTAFFFLWGLDLNGWANPYYSAAAQAGSQDWKAFFFGSFEWGNLITVDKTPLSIWVMSISVRLFGLNTWSILVPQALMGVATTYLIYRILRRGFGAAPALLGGAIYATTPVVFLMSRFNNPEPLMGLLMVGAVYVALKALDNGRFRSFALAGCLLGLAFMAKQVQAFVVVPSLCVAVLAFGQGSLLSRVRQVLVSGASLLATSAIWLLAVELTPATQRPYIGGSAVNSAVELTLDYNGLARFIQIPMTITGNRPGTSHDELAPYNGGFSRVFDGNFEPEIAWLLFPAIALAIVVLILNRTLDFDDVQKKTAVLAIAWLTTAFFLLCFMGSMIHTYYTFSLAAPIALVVPIGLCALWGKRDKLVLRLIGAVVIGSSTFMTMKVLNYSDEWPLWFRTLVVISGVAAVAGWLWNRSSHRWQRFTLVVVAVCLLIGPIGANVYTSSVPQKGTNPQSGPVANDPRAVSRLLVGVRAGTPAWALQTAYGAPTSPSVTELLRHTNGHQEWAAATYSAQNAAVYQLESGRPVIPVGGWLGTDPAPTPLQFRQLVADGRIGYFIWQQDLLDRNELSPETVEITHWVQDNFKEQTIDGVRIYDLRP